MSGPFELTLPDLGDSVTEGTVIEWRKAVGDAVVAGDILLDITTDKVDVEVPSPTDGVLTRIVAAAGATIAIGDLLAEITASNGAGAPQVAPVAAATADAPDAIPVEIVLPPMESVVEGTVVEWRKAVGDPVAAEDIVVEVSTDKVDIEVPSPAAGTLTAIHVPAGETFSVTTSLGTIAVGVTSGQPATVGAPPPEPKRPAAEPPRPTGDLLAEPATPLARRLSAEVGVALSSVRGTGPGGIVRRRDVHAAANGASAPAASTPASAAADETVVALKGPAAVLAAYMNESRAIPTATTFRTVNVAELDRQRRALNGALAAAGRPEKLSYTHLVAWAIVRSVERVPVMGTAFTDEGGAPHKIQRDHVNFGIAVDVERKDGSRSLLVPVIRAAETIGFDGFYAAFADLIARSRVGKVTPDELRGGSVSLTNPGGFGTIASVPRLMTGQGTIVATGSIAYPPGFESVDPARLAELGVGKVMTMTSTYDHRVIQGAESGAFLRQIDHFLQGEDGFYAEVASALGIAEASAAPAGVAVAATAPVAVAATSAPVDDEVLLAVALAMAEVRNYRTHGHLAARLDPLGSEPEGWAAFDPTFLGLTPSMMARVPASVLSLYLEGETFADALPRLRETYCGTIAYEIEHISDREQRHWLREEIETGGHRVALDVGARRELLRQLVRVDAFDRFLRRTYLGQKTFSIEGVDALVPIMNEIIERSAAAGAAEVVIGMAHRGRLNVITNVVGQPEEQILAEFEGHMEVGLEMDDDEIIPPQTAGDVKYHLGAEGTFVSRSGRPITVTLAPNPSHLEQVNAVVQGRTRARQTLRKGREAAHDATVAVPVLVHGDAAFPGQGVNAEALNLQALRGYTTGGVIHIIANNQVGFTTDPPDSRSTRYASDLAKGFDMPIIHVNGDDAEACVAAVNLAIDFRNKFGRDVLIDLIGYRRLGHNEVDEPAYTQPVMSRIIKNHPTPCQVYGQRLVEQGAITTEELRAVNESVEKHLADALANVRAQLAAGTQRATDHVHTTRQRKLSIRTAVDADLLNSLNEQLITAPEGFNVHAKLTPQLERRRTAMTEGGITWAHAESLAFSSLLVDGVSVRLTGQDAERGTFSQRHLVLHDISETDAWHAGRGRTFTPMNHLLQSKATFEVHNSPLSEAACVGFEYGYSTEAPGALVLWEAQYGDFANGAQIMIDQFISSGHAKWGQPSRLTLLLPHGYEGNGPEHSSARPERFLQLAAQDNMRVANCSTAAQYFHLLRKQALSDETRPLVVMTPKSLLRLKAASCSLAELSGGQFSYVIDDPTGRPRRDRVHRMLLCTGKVFHELDAHAAREAADDLVLVRIEMLAPFPHEAVRAVIERYPNITEVSWVQEEPKNMGAWDYIARGLRVLMPEGVELGYVGRPPRASPSEGWPQAHQEEQQRLLDAAFAVGAVTIGG
ncbi:MAG: multifunctional oxoglutarate decarboxylase/oxoglutarate dehydrogenase thiamine pyrophosphate-binding subunit/dihydrolipoyllysine-residue succinyltransferase subunit [Actinobacteria bacterium]|nr:multifunctional oxoglutarate decarboxylase/oxoglutarate dehydrogenase thiamine pyrophosphate-binding subunit/dihydrolipoyllysine-residue succinyltransferase subunit [Actinomycetota bacterium]